MAASSSGGYLLPSILPSQKLFDVPVVRMHVEGTGGKAIAAREGTFAPPPLLLLLLLLLLLPFPYTTTYTILYRR